MLLVSHCHDNHVANKTKNEKVLAYWPANFNWKKVHGKKRPVNPPTVCECLPKKSLSNTCSVTKNNNKNRQLSKEHIGRSN